jgi:pyrimidine-nucleoside phosphorylase
MRMYDIILKKRNGNELTDEEIDFFVQGYTRDDIPDYQVSALMMAIYFQGMSKRETADLTMSMVKSGKVLDLSGIEGIKVDKHSTGGVGDKTTLVLAPLVASVGVPMAKMSGRGLGHTGGTIDKLESFPGFSVEMSMEKFIENVREHGIVIGGQTADLAPADKKLYALRDVTATVDNISLIASSIMSKKLAGGADAILLDVKTGSGAFMKEEKSSFDLAREMVKIGSSAGKETVAVVTDMDQPLGYAVGNILEVKEAVMTLKGRGPDDLAELCLILGSRMVVMAGKAESPEKARKMLTEAVGSGKAFEKFREFIKSQGGDPTPADNPEFFPESAIVREVETSSEGYVHSIQAEKIGKAALVLGAGREKKDSSIDLSTGIVLSAKKGDWVSKGKSIATVYARNDKACSEAQDIILEAFEIGPESITLPPLVKGLVTADSEERY